MLVGESVEDKGVVFMNPYKCFLADVAPRIVITYSHEVYDQLDENFIKKYGESLRCAHRIS